MSKFVMNPLVYFGENALQEATFSLASLGNKALVVTDKSMIQLHMLDPILEVLKKNGHDYVLFDDVNNEPTISIVEDGIKKYNGDSCDYVIALGGGSVIDAAKAIVMRVSMSATSYEYYIKNEFNLERPTLVAIPTTAGTGSEVTKFTIITDEDKKIKMLLKGDRLIPDIAIIDPFFTMTLPPSITLSTGLDALCHATESYLSIKATDLSKSFSIQAMKRIFEYLPVCIKNGNDKYARAQMSLAAFEAGIAFSNSSVTLIHGMSRPIGAIFHIPHGNSNAMLLLSCMEYIQEQMPNELNKMMSECGFLTSYISYLKSFLNQFTIKSLSDYNVRQDDFINSIDKMIDDAFGSGSPQNLGIDITRDDMKRIYLKLVEQE